MLDDQVALSDDWRRWVVENLLRGAPHDDLVRALAEQDVPEKLAQEEVAALASSPALAVCAGLTVQLERYEQVMRLQRHRRAVAPRPTKGIARRHDVTPAELIEHHFAPGVPLVLEGAAARWPAFGKWTPAFFRERYGAVELEVCRGRNQDPRCDRNFRALSETVSMAQFIDDVLAAGSTNDLYAIANNALMRLEALAPLLDDVVADPELFKPLTGGDTALWIGPAGTVTPLHHDSTNILFFQLHGRKRFDFVSPFESALVRDADGYYAACDLGSDAWNERYPEVAVESAELAAGDALFVPAGWWHRVEALDVSISFSLLGFRCDNDYGWYKPGKTTVVSAP